MVRSADQDEELLSSVIVTGLSKKGTNVGEKVIVGAGNGVLTLWERGVWDDQDERITVDKEKGGGESLDTLAVVPDGVGAGGKIVAVGMGNGTLRFVKVGPNKVVGELKHDELQSEAVVGLGFDVTGRMISGGGRMIKVWEETLATEQSEAAAESDSDDSDSDDDSEDEAEDSSDEEKDSKKRKKRKRTKAKQPDNGIMGFSGLD